MLRRPKVHFSHGYLFQKVILRKFCRTILNKAHVEVVLGIGS
jgi:hypothetical protein